jgi:hypothetical protein
VGEAPVALGNILRLLDLRRQQAAAERAMKLRLVSGIRFSPCQRSTWRAADDRLRNPET